VNATIYQTTAAYNVGGSKFVNYNNCTSSICDYSLANWEKYAGNCYFNSGFCGQGTYQAACAYSDVNLKTKIETLQNVMEKIKEIETVEFDWNENIGKEAFDTFQKNKKLHQIGLIAQNVRVQYPEVVGMGPEGYYFIDYTKLNAVVVEGIKEQQLFIDDIDNKLQELEQRFN